MKSERAKVLHPLLGRPMCAYPVARALAVGASPLVAVVGFQADQVTSALEHAFPGQPLRFALQREQKGTAHAVQCAQPELQGYSGPILILYGDVPLLRRETLDALLKAFRNGRGPLALVTTVPPDPTGLGRVIRSRGQVVGIVEQKDCTAKQLRIAECNPGIYAVDADFLWKSLPRIGSANAQREFYLTDLVRWAAKKGKVSSIAADFLETAGVNDRRELAACARALQARINARHMEDGVTLLDPDSTFIDELVEIGADVEIGPQVSIWGATRIGRRVRIDQGSYVGNSTIGEDTEIRPYSVLEQAQVGARCILGPFCRLRPGTELAEAVHIGNFVELKKASLGKGTKANHLSYLGDAQIGAGVNVGAGTITCNYDGTLKHRTVLGDNVFVGSDTQLVAPVTVGAGAFIAAGTTVTEDVPPLSLVLSRTPQVVKEGWVEKRAQAAKPAGNVAKVSTKAG
jgi:bifunctional UDP-N-acetylglucosamine pyrophosphorylase/glucosamine-1-phosphate N-acetyltransferase